MLFVLEGTVRILYTVRNDVKAGAPAWYVYSPALGWTRRPGFHGVEGGYYREFDADGYFTADSKEVNAAGKKVVLLGDSNTFGFGAPTGDSFAEVLHNLLPDTAIVNLGVIGATSYQGQAALSKYLPLLNPSVVVVSYNFNDRRYVLHRGEIDSADNFQQMWKRSVGIRAMTQTL